MPRVHVARRPSPAHPAPLKGTETGWRGGAGQIPPQMSFRARFPSPIEPVVVSPRQGAASSSTARTINQVRWPDTPVGADLSSLWPSPRQCGTPTTKLGIYPPKSVGYSRCSVRCSYRGTYPIKITHCFCSAPSLSNCLPCEEFEAWKPPRQCSDPKKWPRQAQNRSGTVDAQSGVATGGHIP